MRPLTILHVVTKLSAAGGIGNQLLKLLRIYDRKMFSPVVCSLSEKGPIAKEMENLGIEVIGLGIDFRKGLYPGAIRKLYNIMKIRQISILRCHGYRSSLHGVPAGVFAGVPCIVTSSHNIYMPRDRKLNRKLTNKCLSYFSDRVVAVSEAVKKDVMRYDMVSEAKIRVIHNGVNADRFVHAEGQRVRTEFGIPSDVPVVGTVGRLFRQKGHRYLMEAVSVLRRDIPDIRLVMVGDGPLRNDFEHLAMELNISKNTIFTGSRRDIPELLAAMDVFVFPSLWEGFGNALVEAMAAGRSIVASDIPPVREIIASADQAKIVPPKDPLAIAEAVRLLLSNRETANRLGQSAQRQALSNFTIESTYDKYKSLYLEILGKEH